MKFDLHKEVKKIGNDIIQWRRDLHEIPEVGYELHKTVAYVTAKLDEMEISYEKICDGSGVLALINPNSNGKVLGIRADMDALPIEEETGLTFASKHEGYMHACGHDTHTAVLLGVAKVLKAHEKELDGTVKLIFQCNEEGLCGAKRMIEEGALDNPKVDSIIGMHIASINLFPSGYLVYSHGETQASSDKFYIKLIGQGVHASTPHFGVDPITMACRVVQELHSMRAMEIDTLTPAVITVGTLKAGSGAFNVIPEYAEIIGTTRTFDNKLRPHIKERMESLVKGIAESHRGTYEFKYDFLCPSLHTTKEESDKLVSSIEKCGYKDISMELPIPIMGSEDMAEYIERVPGTFFYLNAPLLGEDGVCYPAHSPKFKLDESQFHKAVEVFVQYTFDYLG